ncbi:GNAT family N-acetyltransferase [Subtercola sp. YIM 133946]|uniref:GNAT family N-acetyltransferase n=1 Tax=Subtercola sp. YIM 133946 TaxID=3118909 RepID=UPI002F93AB45
MTVTLRPMPDEVMRSWLDTSNAHYEAERVANGDSPEEAARRARESREQYFPGDQPIASHAVFEVLAGGEPVGVLWLGPLTDERPDEWWVFDIEIDEAHRGQGYGRATMRLAETAARERGAVKLGLNVFGSNTVAQSLYTSLDYTVTAINMSKSLLP